MEIDNVGRETIVLYPRAYNKRGDERLHSVQGVTRDGVELNVKLRIDESMVGKEIAPSIAEFSREDVKAKNPCLATPDNSPQQREGVLLFTGCEPDGENKRGLPTYIARWAYVLASHSDAPEPVFGLGRVAIIADSHHARRIQNELNDIEKLKPEGWEALVEHKRRQLSDPMLFSYYGQLYLPEDEALFAYDQRQPLIEHAQAVFDQHTGNGQVAGLLVRLQRDEGSFDPALCVELFPRWAGSNQYQKAADVLSFFFRAHDSRLKASACKLAVMPIKRYSCGPSFKNYYFARNPEESLNKIRRRFLINNEPTLSLITLVLSRREDTGENFLQKFYPMSAPLGAVARLGEKAPEEADSAQLVVDDSSRPCTGLSDTTALHFPSWYSPALVRVPVLPTAHVEHTADSADLPSQGIAQEFERVISDEPVQSETVDEAEDECDLSTLFDDEDTEALDSEMSLEELSRLQAEETALQSTALAESTAQQAATPQYAEDLVFTDRADLMEDQKPDEGAPTPTVCAQDTQEIATPEQTTASNELPQDDQPGADTALGRFMKHKGII